MNSKNIPYIFSVLILVLILSIPHAKAFEPVWTYPVTGNKIGGVSMSSDGTAIAVGADKVLVLSRYGELLAKEPYGKQVLFTRNGSVLISSYGPSLYFFQGNATNSTFQKKWEYELPDTLGSMDISDDGKTIVAASKSGGTYVFTNSGKMTGSNANYSSVVRVSPNGQRILGVSSAGICRYSSTGSCFRYKNISIISKPDVMELTTSGETMVYNDDQRLLCVNTATGNLQWNARATGDITALAMTPDGTKILVGSQNGNVDRFEGNGNVSWSYMTNPSNISGIRVSEIALSADGMIAAVGTYEGKIVILNAAGKEIWSNMTKDHINHIAMSGDGSFVVATGEETVYAFSSSAKFPQTTMTPQGTGSIVEHMNSTHLPSTTAPQKRVEVSHSASHVITSVPTTYSVIRTSTQSPVDAIISLLGFLGAAFLLMKKR